MLPLGPRLAVARLGGEQTLASGIILPAPDMRDAHVGLVSAVGTEHENGCPLEVAAGDRVLYSSRVDTFVVDDGTIDVVDENSVIGIL